MDRRKFLRNGSLTGIGFTTVDGWRWMAGGHTSGKISSKNLAEQAQVLDLEEITVMELQKKMQAGEQTSVSITKAYLARIEKIDRNGPSLNSIIELNPDALK